MVAISLYRGNLHRVPDVARGWLMPTPKISLKHFKSLLNRRNKALSRPPTNPNPNSNQINEPPTDNDGGASTKLDGEDCPPNHLHKNPKTTQSHKVDVSNEKEKEKRKRVVEEELQVLNAKKHKLVLVLKQILNVEEELRTRNCTQGIGMPIRPSLPLQLDPTNDSASITRHAANRMDGILGGDMEGGEADDASNLNMHSRHMLRMSSTSPSSESPLRKSTFIQHNVVPLPSRATLGATSSPSRFAPTGHQGHPGNLPTVSVSGTNYIASSPSPAASGGTSVFRDARQPSPWN